MALDGPMTGTRKAAIALMVLGEEGASAIFKHLHQEEIERIVCEVAALGTVSPDVSELVLTELNNTATASNGMTAGGIESARRLLSRALSPEESKRIFDRIVHLLQTNSGFASLEYANPQQLSKFIMAEHPQTTALILAHMNPGSAAQLLEQLPNEMRAEVMLRMANLEEIPPDVIARVSSVIEHRLRGLGGAIGREQRGGVRAVAELFNRLDRSISRPALTHMESLAPETAMAIRNLMFIFDDIIHIEETGIREIVNRADKRTLTLALKGASEEIRGRFFSNMSKRAVDLMKEEMELLGAVRLRDVEKAQQEVVGIARKLEEEGMITTGAGAGDSYVS